MSQAKRQCQRCALIFCDDADIPSGNDTTMTSGRYINNDGEPATFRGYLCEMHIHDIEWIGRPTFTTRNQTATR